jgi:transcriptional regulator with XRE-family HTH domain
MRMSGMDQTVISKIEHGNRRVTLDELMALAAALGTSPGFLLVPTTPGARVRVHYGRVERASDVWQWLVGVDTLDGMDDRAWRASAPDYAREMWPVIEGLRVEATLRAVSRAMEGEQ